MTIDLDDVAGVIFSEDNPLLADIYAWSDKAPAQDIQNIISTLYAQEINDYTQKKDLGLFLNLAGGMSTGVGLCLGGISLLLDGDSDEMTGSFKKALGIIGLVFTAAGLTELGFGISLQKKGKKGLESLESRYYQEYGTTLYLGPTGNGIGLALNF